MDKLSAALDQQQKDAEAQEQSQRDNRDLMDRVALTAKLNHLDGLMVNPDVKWFIEELVGPLLFRESASLHDIRTAPEARNLAAHRLDIGREIAGLIESEHRDAHARLEAIARGLPRTE